MQSRTYAFNYSKNCKSIKCDVACNGHILMLKYPLDRESLKCIKIGSKIGVETHLWIWSGIVEYISPDARYIHLDYRTIEYHWADERYLQECKLVIINSSPTIEDGGDLHFTNWGYASYYSRSAPVCTWGANSGQFFPEISGSMSMLAYNTDTKQWEPPSIFELTLLFEWNNYASVYDFFCGNIIDGYIAFSGLRAQTYVSIGVLDAGGYYMIRAKIGNNYGYPPRTPYSKVIINLSISSIKYYDCSNRLISEGDGYIVYSRWREDGSQQWAYDVYNLEPESTPV